tara:strand:- start:443 stop:634 length:192 start_codon:yes stop_codon:yes gene_type:complete
MKTRKEFTKHTIKMFEDLIKNHSYMEWDNPEGNRVVHIDDIKEKIKELKITLKKQNYEKYNKQ